MIELQQKIMDMKKQPLKVMDEEGVKHEVTLEEVCSQALLTEYPEEKNSMQEKDKRYRIWLKILDKDEVSLKAEEITLIKTQIAKRYPPLVCGQACALLEGEDPFAIKDEE